MMDQPGTQQKLVLPAPPQLDAEPHMRRGDGLSSPAALPVSSGKHPAPVRPAHLIRTRTAPTPKGPLAKLGYFWRKDPAYKVFIVAIAVVVLASMLFVSLASAALLGNTGLFAGNNTPSQNSSAGIAPASTVDLQPTFPTPGGNTGSKSSSQPPAQSTPVLQNTPIPTPQPSPTPGGSLTVQITSIPLRVPNNSRVSVGVTTNQEDVNVRLQVAYNMSPFYYTSGQRRTDANGNATLVWTINVYQFGRNATATVIAIATDQNGQMVRSAPITVQVITRF